jgi:outer membrane protein assembly factor BamB
MSWSSRGLRFLRCVALVGVVSVVAGGCNWLSFRGGAARTGVNPYEFVLNAGNIAHLAESWTASTGGAVESSPAVEMLKYRTVYVGSDDGKLYAFDATLGTLEWTGATGGPVRSSPAVAGDLVYVGSDDGKLYAFDAAGSTGCAGVPKTCDPVWTATTGGPVPSSPAVVGGLVYAGSDDGTLYAFDAADGSPVWTADAACVGGGSGVCAMATPAVAGGVVYVGSDEGEGLSESGALYAFDASDGTPLWTVPVGIVQSSPAVANGSVYVSAAAISQIEPEVATDTLRGFDAVSGDLLLSGTVGSGRAFSSPLIAPPLPGYPMGGVSVGSGDGSGVTFDAAGVSSCSGSPAICTPIRISVVSAPAISSLANANGVIYASTSSGTLDLYIYGSDPGPNCPAPPDLCTPIRSVSLGAPSRSSPAVSTGWVYVGTDDGKLHALRLIAQTSGGS